MDCLMGGVVNRITRSLFRWSLLISIFVSSAFVYAEAESSTPVFHTLEIGGKTETFRFETYRNDMDILELKVSHEELRKVFPDTSSVVLWGRDLDDDGLMDAWFYYDRNGVLVSKDQRSFGGDGWDIAKNILLMNAQIKNRWYSGILVTRLLETLSIAVNVSQATSMNAIQMDLELLELEIRLNRMVRKSGESDLTDLMRRELIEGTDALYNMVSISHRLKQDSLGLGADLLLYLTGAKLIEWLGGVTKGAGAWLAESALSRYLTGLQKRSAALVEKLRPRVGATSAIELEESVLLKKGVKQSIQARVRATLKGLTARNRLVKKILDSFVNGSKSVATVATQGLKENGGYMAMTQSIQIVAEVAARPEELYDPNPIIMAKKIATNKEFLQDFAYMTSETIGAGTLSTVLKEKSYLNRMIACGIYSMVDSGVMNIAVKHEADAGRIAFDTGWGVVVGNTQVQVDLASIRYFERLSSQKNLAGLKFFGYAVAVLDQAVGYYGYGLGAKKYQEYKTERDQKATVKIVPVYAPAY